VKLPLAFALLIAACSSSPSAPADAAVDLTACSGSAGVNQPCTATPGGCTGCLDGLACEPLATHSTAGRCRPACAALPPPCAAGFCCDTQSVLSTGGTTNTCEDSRLPGVACDTLDGGGI